MNQIKKIVICCITTLFCVGAFSCIDEESTEPQGKDRYLDPPWLGGTSIETLEDTVNYSIFIELMDKANYREPIEKQLFTLFVPNDDAFKSYFQKIGKSGVSDLSEDEAVSIFTLHVLPNARSAFQLKYEYYWNELQDENGEYASLFFRKQTASEVIPYKETPKYHHTYKDRELTIYNDPKILPLMSYDFFEDFFGALDGSDYEMLYPDSKWSGDLNWHNAAVTDAEVRTASGFIYFVDQVVGPAPSIEEYFIENKDQFGVFYDMAQRFATYKNPTKRIEDNSLMYKKSYDLILDFANEFGPETESPRYFKNLWSAFIPTNDVLQKYLDEKLLNHYESLDSVPVITLYYILQTHLTNGLALMSKVEKSFYNSFGDRTEISRDDIAAGYMCSNGPFYSMNKVLEPNIFKSVPRILFFNNNYSTFLYAMSEADLISSLSDPEYDVTLFAVDNDKLEEANIRYNSVSNRIETRGEDGIWNRINSEVLIEFLEDHIYVGKLDDLSGEGYLEMQSKNYVYYKNGEIVGGDNVNLNETAAITNSGDEEINGILYTLDNAIKTRYEFGELLTNDPDCSEFANLLVEADLLNLENLDQVTSDTIPKLLLTGEIEYWTAFIPNNQAIEDAYSAGIIPTDIDSLKDFILYHFIANDVIFDNGVKSGPFNTVSVVETTSSGTEFNKLQISNSVNNLSVTDISGQQLSVDHTNANLLVRRGVIHKISSVLKK